MALLAETQLRRDLALGGCGRFLAGGWSGGLSAPFKNACCNVLVACDGAPECAARSASSRRPRGVSPRTPATKVAAQAGCPKLGTDGNVLQVRLGGGDAPGACLGLDEGRVDPPVRGFGVQQAVHVGGQQLGVGAVFQDLVNDRAVGAQAFQCLGVGGVAARRLFARRQAQLVEQRLAQLLGTIYIELITDFCINIVQDTVQLAPPGCRRTRGCRRRSIAKTDALHVGQHPGPAAAPSHSAACAGRSRPARRPACRTGPPARPHRARPHRSKGGVYTVLGARECNLNSRWPTGLKRYAASLPSKRSALPMPPCSSARR